MTLTISEELAMENNPTDDPFRDIPDHMMFDVYEWFSTFMYSCHQLGKITD